METIWDWSALAVFAGIVVLFLQRSVGPRPEHDRIINYLPPAVGCALANYLGNEEHVLLATAVLIAAVVYIIYVLRPFNLGSR